MGLFLVRKDRIILISDRTMMLTGYILGVFIGLIAKRVIKKLKEKQKVHLPNPGGSQLNLELYNQNELGYIIMSCISDYEQFLVKDPRLNELLFSLIRAKINNESIIIHPNLLRFIATRLINPNTGLITKLGNLVVSSHKSKLMVQLISSFAVGMTNAFFMSLFYTGFAMLVIFSSTSNCFDCDRYFQKLTPTEQEQITRVYADRLFGNLLISNSDLSRQLEIYVPSSTTETISEVINENEVKRTRTYQKSRTKARQITFD